MERFRATEGEEGEESAEAGEGIRIDTWTATPGAASGSGWADEPFDVDLALGFFRGNASDELDAHPQR